VKVVEYQHDWFGLFADSLAPGGSVVVRAEAGVGVSECLRHRVSRLRRSVDDHRFGVVEPGHHRVSKQAATTGQHQPVIVRHQQSSAIAMPVPGRIRFTQYQ
jgi:hypothetical protein